MSKTAYLPPPSTSRPIPAPISTWLSRAVTTCLVSIAVLLLLAHDSSPTSNNPTRLHIKRDAVQNGIDWLPCPDSANTNVTNTFYCATLEVPLNWMDTSGDGTKVSEHPRSSCPSDAQLLHLGC